MNEFYASVTVRVSFDFVKFLAENSGKGKKFRDKSAGLRHYVELGQRVESLIEIRKDPKKQKEFDEKLAHIMNTENLGNIIDTMDETELDAILVLASSAKKKKIQQVIDLVKKS